MANGLPAFQRSYEIAPIILTGGLAANLPDGAMTILTLTEGSEANYGTIEHYFARFKVLPGGSLQDWGIAEYPFANMTMAANAVVQNPLRVSLQMLVPAKSNVPGNSYPFKSARMSAIKTKLDTHITLGGYFTVATPAFTYVDCLLVSMRDVGSGGDKQVQLAYQLDFVQPLITQQAATQTLNSFYNKLNGGLPTKAPLTNSSVSNSIGNTGSQALAPYTPGTVQNLP